MLSEIRSGPADFTRRIAQAREQAQGCKRSDARIGNLDGVMIVQELLMLHPIGSIPVGLRRDVPILHVDLHPFIEGPLLHLVEDQLAQSFPCIVLQYGSRLEQLLLQDPSQPDRLEVGAEQAVHQVGMLQPVSVFGSHRDVLQHRQAYRRPQGAGRKVLGVLA